MSALQQELGEATARLAAFNPRQSERLLLEVGRLRETVASLYPYKVRPWTEEEDIACVSQVMQLCSSGVLCLLLSFLDI